MEPWFFHNVSPGEMARKELPIIEMGDGGFLSLRAIIVRGENDGPILYMGAAIHGDEICGIEIMRQLYKRLDPKVLHGSVVMVPVQNPIAFYQRQRFIPGQAFDTFNVNMFNAFPGSAKGEIVAVLAHNLLEEFVTQCDCAVDLHTAMAGGLNLDYCFTPAGENPLVEKTKQLARAFSLPMVMEQEKVGGYIGPNKFHQVATLSGTPTFSVELQQSGRITPDSTHRGVEGFLNIMRLLKMLRDKETTFPEKQYIAKWAEFPRVERAGIYEPKANLGSIVHVGETLGMLYTTDFKEEISIDSPVEGLLYRTATHRIVNASERVASIATDLQLVEEG